MKVAIIPARGGSKRIPRKNIKLFHGKPLIAYSIDAARQAGCFDRIIVSTEDAEIGEIAKKYGAEVPFVRPGEIADDHATTIEVIQHAINWCDSQNWELDAVCCIYATAPFLTAGNILSGLQCMEVPDVQYAFSATTFAFPIQRAISVSGKEGVRMFHPEFALTRSQDLEEAYHDAGQFYWGRPDAFRLGEPIFAEHSRAVILPRKQVQDIDTQEDWEMAEALFSVMMQK